MPNYFRNLEETMNNIDSSKATPYLKFKFWLLAHLRIIWSLVMMLILFFLCLWMSYKAGSSTDGTIIESIGTPVNEEAINNKIEDKVKQNLRAAPKQKTSTETSFPDEEDIQLEPGE